MSAWPVPLSARAPHVLLGCRCPRGCGAPARAACAAAAAVRSGCRPHSFPAPGGGVASLARRRSCRSRPPRRPLSGWGGLARAVVCTLALGTGTVWRGTTTPAPLPPLAPRAHTPTPVVLPSCDLSLRVIACSPPPSCPNILFSGCSPSRSLPHRATACPPPPPAAASALAFPPYLLLSRPPRVPHHPSSPPPSLPPF